MLAAAVRRLEATKSFIPIHTVTLNARGYAIGILNDQLIKREAKKKMRESWHTEYRFSVLYDVVYSTRNWISGGRAILDELRNRGITIVRRFTARKNHLRPRRNGELSIIRVKCYVRWSLAAAASTYFPREEAVGFYVDDRSRMPYHYSSYGTPATSDSESSVME